MIVKITAKDIKEGIPLDMTRCPVALAVNRATKHVYEDVWAGPSHIGTGPRIYKTPEIAARWMDRFDRYGADAVLPISFDVTEEDLVRVVEAESDAKSYDRSY